MKLNNKDNDKIHLKVNIPITFFLVFLNDSFSGPDRLGVETV